MRRIIDPAGAAGKRSLGLAIPDGYVAATVNATEGDATEASNVTIGLSWSTSTLQLTYSFANAKNRKVYSKLQIRNGV